MLSRNVAARPMRPHAWSSRGGRFAGTNLLSNDTSSGAMVVMRLADAAVRSRPSLAFSGGQTSRTRLKMVVGDTTVT
jgi:hypothetical protein